MTPVEIAKAWRASMGPDVLTIITLYERPKDYPQGFVLRPTYVRTGGEMRIDPVAFYADSEHICVSFMRTCFRDLVLMDRHPDDEPHIVCGWL